MKKIFSSILLFVSISIFGQNNNLDFLKSPMHKGDPTIEEAVKWLGKNLESRCGYVLIDNQGGLRETSYPGWNGPNGEMDYPGLKFNAQRNEISFFVDNKGCYLGGAYHTETDEVVIFLDNLDSYFYIDEKNNRLEITSWNSNNKGKNKSDHFLGFIKYSNYDNCSGVSLKPFYSLSFKFDNINIKDRLILALNFIQRKTSAEHKKCLDFGACLAAHTKVLVGKNESISINLLRNGDKILTYDIDNNVFEETEVESVDSVFHKELVQLIFSNDTITCTKDHPFFIENKGWCSLDPENTMKNYSNYSNVSKIQKNDLFYSIAKPNISVNKLIDVVYLEDDHGQMTYTITMLKKGNSYFANGILTGVEHIKNEFMGKVK